MRSVKQNLSAGRTVFFSIPVFLIMLLGSLASLPAYAAPPVENVQCLEGQPGVQNGLVCTAGDISLSSPVVTVIEPCDYPGDTARLQVLVDVTGTAQTRYDIGVWLSVDGDPNGDSSRTGICSALSIPITALDTLGNSVNIDGDQCGDVVNTGNLSDISNVDMGTVDFFCDDSDGDGNINVPLIITWDNKSDANNCPSTLGAVPNTKSKCSAVNDINVDVPVPGRLIVNKVTQPANALDFPFNLTGDSSPNPGGFDGDYDFTLANGEQFDSGSGVLVGGLLAGDYVLVENPTPGWQSTGTCESDIDGANTDPANLSMRAGETITCDFVNVSTVGELFVRKTTTGFTTGTFGFTVADGNGTIATPSLDTTITNPIDSAPIAVDVSETYTVTETLDPGFILTSAVCTNGNNDPVGTPNLQTGSVSGITVLPADSITCAFANSPAGSITLTKVSVGGDDTFGFHTDVALPNFPTGDFTVMTEQNTGSLAVINVVPSNPTYTVTETIIPPGWRFESAACLDGNENDVSTGNQPAQGVTFTHGVSQTTTCRVTNVKLGRIVINKVTNPGGNVTDSFGFTSNAPGFAAFSLMHGESQNIIDVPVDANPAVTTAYTVTEDDPDSLGFDLTNISCVSSRGDALSSGSAQTRIASINIRAGETVTCTYTNTERATITVEKEISGTNPNGLGTTFSFSSNFAADFDLNPAVGLPDASSAYEVTPGEAYDITEANPNADGWSLVSATCGINGEVLNLGAGTLQNIVPQPGDEITCTFVNAPLGSATIVKNAVGGNGVFGFIGSEEPFNNGGAGFQIDTSVSSSADFTNQLLPNVQYDVLENVVPANWTLTSVICTDLTGNSTPNGTEDPPADPALGALIQAASDETVSCVFTNEADAQLTINKVTVPASDTTTEFAFTGTGDINGSNLVGGGSASTMAPQGTFVAAETPTAGWALTNIACTGVSAQNITIGVTAAFVDGDTDVSLVLAPGNDAECTFTNTKLGSITITKATVGDTGGFTFQGTDSNDAGIITSPFVLTTAGNAGDETVTYTGLLPGTYQFNETVPAGWLIDGLGGDITCTGQNSSVATPGSNSVSIALADGEDVSCTFTNTKLPTLTLVKTVTNDNGGNAGTDDFQASINAVNVPWGIAQEYVPGNYTASETTLPGYTPSDWSGDCAADGSVTLAAGQNATCNITNDDVSPTLQLTKVVNSSFGGNAQPDDFNLTIGGNAVISGAVNDVDANIALAINETQLTGYELVSITGDDKCPEVLGGTVTLDEGEDLACTITNIDVAPKLSVVKIVNNDFGGGALPDDFNLTVGGNAVISGVSNVYTSNTALAINETQLPGYSLVSITGDAKCPQVLGGTVTLDEGDDITCTITNAEIQAQLTLVKQVNINHGGTLDPTEFTLTVGGNAVASGVSNGFDSNTPLAINESPVSGYSFVSITGDAKCPQALGGTVTLASGDDITCIITNEDQPATLTLVKEMQNDNQGSAEASEWNLMADGPTPISGAGGVGPIEVDAGVYTLSETGGQAGYTAGSWSCGQADLNGNQLTLDNGEDVTCTIINDDDPAQINLAKTVNGPAVDNGDGTYTVNYIITATNTGGPGFYDLMDTFSPGIGITLDSATAVYVPGTESDQSGVLGNYPTFVTGEKLASGLNESWAVAAVFTVDPATVTPESGDCDPGNPVSGTGFYNYVDGSVTDADLSDNDACTGLPEPGINLAKSVNGPAVNNGDGTYTVEYTIIATNTGGPGSYDLFDTFSPGAGITLDSATATYVVGTEDDQSGTIGDYPNFVLSEGLAGGLNESWTVTAIFSVDPAGLTDTSGQCESGNPVISTGFYNYVDGSDTESDTSDNDACTGLTDPAINLAKSVKGGAVDNNDGTYTVTYTITATNSGGPGSYDLVDAFSPGDGISLNSATAIYVAGSEDDQSGSIGNYPNFVTGEGLAEGLNESWEVEAEFAVDPVQLDPETSRCGSGDAAEGTGFYNYVDGSDTDTDLSDNDACIGVPVPGINLAKTVNGPAVMNADGTYTVEFLIVATNTGGPGMYDVYDQFSPGSGITLETAAVTYQAGTENNQSGTITVDEYPNFVKDEALGADLDEAWIMTATFSIDPTLVDPVDSQCDPQDPVVNTGFYNKVSVSDDVNVEDGIPEDDEACTSLPIASLTLVKLLNGAGNAVAADFALTLTGVDGTHDSGVDYYSGDQPFAYVGVQYQLTEAAGQVANYFLESIVCTDNDDQSEIALPFALEDGQAVTCTVTNTINEVIFDVVAEACVSDTPYVNYDVTTSSGVAPDVTITWIKNDGSEEIVQTLADQPTMGQLLWPGAAVVNGVPVAWPGWSCDAQGSNCTQINDGLVPSMKLKFDINPTATIVVNYPPATPNCNAAPDSGLTLLKVIEGQGTAVPADFALTLTGNDGIHNSGMDYQNGDKPVVTAGIAYQVSEAADQIDNYFLESIVCTDNSNQSVVAQPFTLATGQSVTCVVTNSINEVVFDVIAEACINDTPYVNYDVTTSEGGGGDVDITWIKNDGSDEIVQQLVNQPLMGQILWPGAAVVNGVPVAWPGWSCDAQGANCVQINDGLVPTMKLLFEINPSATVVVSYPPATPNCAAVPPGTPPPPAIAVPVDNALALLLLTLMLMATGWYMRPAVMRKL